MFYRVSNGGSSIPDSITFSSYYYGSYRNSSSAGYLGFGTTITIPANLVSLYTYVRIDSGSISVITDAQKTSGMSYSWSDENRRGDIDTGWGSHTVTISN